MMMLIATAAGVIREFEWVRAKSHKKLPPVSGCYGIWLKQRLLYVGSAVNLRNRFGLHQIEYGRVNGRAFQGDPKDIVVRYVACSKEHLAYIEAVLIRGLNPEMNKVRPWPKPNGCVCPFFAEWLKGGEKH